MGTGFFISHYANDSEDESSQKVLFQYGPEGYGMYWLIAEMLAGSIHGKRKCDDFQFKAMDRKFFAGAGQTQAFVLWGIENGIYQTNGEEFWCDRVNDLVKRAGNAIKKDKGEIVLALAEARSRAPGSEYPADFEEFWKAYPRRECKAKAYEQWLLNAKSGNDPRAMIVAAAEYAKSKIGTDPQYILMPSTFLGPTKRWSEYTGVSTTHKAPDHVECPVCQNKVHGTSTVCKTCGCDLTDTDTGIDEHRELWKSGKLVKFNPSMLSMACTKG